ncbi:MAG: peptidylprolyl isomerase [Chloroflexi bacterium]|nr:peptidylprolyl isomerase [Chloroflexota bacterium]
MTIDKSKKHTATLHTSKGDIVVELFASEAPITVNNFVFLARDGFYNGVKFHRVIKGFMIQGGDPRGDGTGGPGYRFNDEPATRKYVRGTIAMANSGPNTNGSQFFIVHQDYPLPPQYTIFGIVTRGFDVVDAIANAPVAMGADGAPSRPTQDILISSIDIAVQ